MRIDFAQGFFQASLLVTVAMRAGFFDLYADSLAFGGAAGQRHIALCGESRAAE
ncbi:hypothetical protein D3C84_1213880 [compost metagenome]